jgi:hypothetical protein
LSKDPVDHSFTSAMCKSSPTITRDKVFRKAERVVVIVRLQRKTKGYVSSLRTPEKDVDDELISCRSS